MRGGAIASLLAQAWRRGLRVEITTWLAWLLPLFAWGALTYPGPLEVHSGFVPVFNLHDLARQAPGIGWVPLVGQPYDLWRGEGALPYRLALLAHAGGLSADDAVKVVFAGSLLAGALGTYAWARRHLSPWAALLAGLVYALWPIGLATVYVRGAFAEAVLLGLLPWTLWAATRPGSGNAGTKVAGLPGQAGVLALLVVLVLWTQAGLALWLTAIILAYLAAQQATGRARRAAVSTAPPQIGGPQRRIAFAPWLAVVVGVAVGSLGLLPVVARHGLGGQTYVRFSDHAVFPHQLLAAGWGVGPSIPGPEDTLTFSLGIAACGLAALSLAARRPTEGAAPTSTGSALQAVAAAAVPRGFALALLLLLVLLSSTLANWAWGLMPVLARTLTYPWQLLLLAGPWLALLAGAGAEALLQRLPSAEQEAGERALGVALATGLMTLVLLESYGFLYPRPAGAAVGDAPIAIFGEHEIALLSVARAGVPGPGGRITAVARWQALRPLADDYTVFFHVVGPDGTLQGQHDTMPRDGQLPTSQWRPGQVVSDQYRATLKPDAPLEGTYTYYIGLYRWQTGERLRVGADDKVVIP